MGSVTFDASGVAYNASDGMIHRVSWVDLRSVEIATTDEGPFVEDVFWVLHTPEQSLVIPQSASGSEELLGRLQLLKGFDNKTVIAAMSCGGNERFVCWERDRTAPEG